MIWLGVPAFDWVLLLVVLGLGLEAWFTTRLTPEERADDAARREAESRAVAHSMSPTQPDASPAGEARRSR